MSAHTVLSYIAAGDHRLMRKVNGWPAPRWIRFWMVAATKLGDGWLWYAMGLIILLFGGVGRYQTLLASGLACACGSLLFVKLKRICGRQRPCEIEPHCWASLLPPDRFSFPSGHSITACAIATPLSLHYPGLAIGLGFCALSIAVSRVILGLHFLSDVIAGCALGFGLGLCSYLLI